MAAWLALVPAISSLIDKLIPDKQAAAQAKIDLLKEENAHALEEMRLALQADTNQTDINKVEAANTSIFVSGWRPFIGWVCGVAFGYHFIIQPLLAFSIANTGGDVKLPQFDMDALFTVLMGMLGLGSLRTIEKIKAK